MKSYLEFCIKQDADLIRNIVQFLKLVASCIKVYEDFLSFVHTLFGTKRTNLEVKEIVLMFLVKKLLTN